MKKVWNFFSSVRLTIVLAILICVVAAWGSILSMRYPSFYRALDGQVLFPFLVKEGARYPLQTLWIYLLVYLTFFFTVNTAVCTANKVYSIIRLRMPWQSFFPHLVHIGFLVAVMGHLAGSAWGYKTNGNLVFRGQTVPVPHETGLFVRLDDTDMKVSSTGEPEYIKTKVTLIRDKAPVLTDTIGINSPLIYDGIAFYHFDQGKSPSGLILNDGGSDIRADFSGAFRASDGASFRLAEIYPDFALDGRGEPFSRSEEFRNPYVEVVASGGKRAFLDISNPGTSVALDGHSFVYRDYTVTPYVILAINRDPGIWLIIIGSSILVIGMVLLLFFRGARGELVRQDPGERA